jgi:hypothetical protein
MAAVATKLSDSQPQPMDTTSKNISSKVTLDPSNLIDLTSSLLSKQLLGLLNDEQLFHAENTSAASYSSVLLALINMPVSQFQSLYNSAVSSGLELLNSRLSTAESSVANNPSAAVLSQTLYSLLLQLLYRIYSEGYLKTVTMANYPQLTKSLLDATKLAKKLKPDNSTNNSSASATTASAPFSNPSAITPSTQLSPSERTLLAENLIELLFQYGSISESGAMIINHSHNSSAASSTANPIEKTDKTFALSIAEIKQYYSNNFRTSFPLAHIENHKISSLINQLFELFEYHQPGFLLLSELHYHTIQAQHGADIKLINPNEVRKRIPKKPSAARPTDYRYILKNNHITDQNNNSKPELANLPCLFWLNGAKCRNAGCNLPHLPRTEQYLEPVKRFCSFFQSSFDPEIRQTCKNSPTSCTMGQHYRVTLNDKAAYIIEQNPPVPPRSQETGSAPSSERASSSSSSSKKRERSKTRSRSPRRRRGSRSRSRSRSAERGSSKSSKSSAANKFINSVIGTNDSLEAPKQNARDREVRAGGAKLICSFHLRDGFCTRSSCLNDHVHVERSKENIDFLKPICVHFCNYERRCKKGEQCNLRHSLVYFEHGKLVERPPY